MAAESHVAANLSAASSTPLVDVAGDLVLNGTLDGTGAEGFWSGTYRLFDYAGTLSGSGLVIGTTPAETNVGDLTIQTASLHQANLVVGTTTASFWNSGAIGSGSSNGGSGTEVTIPESALPRVHS